eukprot:9205115-Ditylum_brightwellii.AAC.1
MALKSGRMWNANQFLELPLTDDIIERAETITKQQIDKAVFEASLMLPYELQDRHRFKEVRNDDTDEDTDSNYPAMNEAADPDPLIMVPDGVNLIDDDDVSNRGVVMKPVDLDFDTDDDNGVQENDDDSDMISLALAEDIDEP